MNRWCCLVLTAMVMWRPGALCQVVVRTPLPEIKAVIIAPENFVRYAEDPMDGEVAGGPPLAVQQKVFAESAERVVNFLKANTFQVDIKTFLGAAANRNAVLKEIARTPKQGQPSLVLVYYAGHGFLPPEGRLTQNSRFAMEGCDLGKHYSNRYDKSISLEEVASLLAGQPERSFMIFLDACHAGGFASNWAGSGSLYTQYGLDQRGVAVVSSGKDESSFNAVFTQALIQEGSAEYPDVNRPEALFVDRLNARMQGLTGYDRGQRPQILLGDVDLRTPPLHHQHATLFVTVRQGRTPKSFSLTLETTNASGVLLSTTIWPEKYSRTPCFFVSVPRRPFKLMLRLEAKDRELAVDLPDQSSVAAVAIDIEQYVQASAAAGMETGGLVAVSGVNQQEEMERAFASYLNAAVRLGAPLEQYALPALQAAVGTATNLDVAPMMKQYLEVQPDKTGPLARAGVYLVRADARIPIDQEGCRVASFIAENKMGGWTALSRFNGDMASGLIKKDPAVESLVRDLYGKSPEDYLTYYLGSTMKYAMLSGDRTAYLKTRNIMADALKKSPSALSTKDVKAFVLMDNNTRALLQNYEAWVVGPDGQVNQENASAYQSLMETQPGVLYERYKNAGTAVGIGKFRLDAKKPVPDEKEYFVAPDKGKYQYTNDASIFTWGGAPQHKTELDRILKPAKEGSG